MLQSVLELPIQGYSRIRSAGFAIEGAVINALSKSLPLRTPVIPISPEPVQNELQRELTALLNRDAKQIREGMYPIQVLQPESPMRHLLRIPRLLADGYGMSLRRGRGRTTVFDEQASQYLDDVPKYYRRNFHFQSNGYLSAESAELYEHQVEILFTGAADAMRRLILPPMRKALGKGKGEGLRVLEIGAGTGRATRFTSLAFPKAKIIATDLSSPYLKVAQERLKDRPRVDFIQADGAKLPFQAGYFDAVYSVFLFHEVPQTDRLEILKELNRVLKPGGFMGLVDSLQLGDRPALDSALGEFPKLYHEPFYRNYVENPMPELIEQAGFGEISSDFGFLSKSCAAIKPA